MSATRDTAGLRVLVVEDETLVAMLIEDMLGDLGCQVVGPAANVEEALDLAAAGGIDCAVLDVNLAGRSVFPVADRLRELGVPFAFATGYGDAGLRAADQGSPVLQKPFREADLAQVLEALSAARGWPG